jgi:hypothetical protein
LVFIEAVAIEAVVAETHGWGLFDNRQPTANDRLTKPARASTPDVRHSTSDIPFQHRPWRVEHWYVENREEFENWQSIIVY